jgi:Domain of unknown function (DUF6249)
MQLRAGYQPQELAGSTLMQDQVDQVAIVIPVIAILMGVGFAMLSIWLDYRKKREIYRLYHAERLAAIEKGIEVPPLPTEFFQARPDERAFRRHRRWGLTLTFLGAALTAALWGTGTGQYLWGLLPMAIGVAYLLSSILDAREQGPPSGG